jgi:D-threo-aldose 1-dehydrogenase
LRRRRLPGGTLELTELGFGAAQIGNLFRETGEEEAADAVRAAWDAGIRYFDTAPHYGLGLSERRLGAALRTFPRDEFVLSTKVGRLLEPTGRSDRLDPEGFAVPATTRRVRDYSRGGVLRSIEASLERLGLDRIDVVLVHDPDDHLPQALGEAAPALSQLRCEGVIGAYGAGMNQSAALTRFVRETDVDVVMLAGRYTLLEQPALADLLPAALERGVGVINVGVFNSGLLSRPRPQEGAAYNYAAAPPELLARAHRIADVCERHGTTLPVTALAFGLRHPAITGVALGLRNRAQVEESLVRYREPVPPALWSELGEAGLIPAEVVA